MKKPGKSSSQLGRQGEYLFALLFPVRAVGRWGKQGVTIDTAIGEQPQPASREALLTVLPLHRCVPLHRDILGCNTPGQKATNTGLSQPDLPVTQHDTCAKPKKL